MLRPAVVRRSSTPADEPAEHGMQKVTLRLMLGCGGCGSGRSLSNPGEREVVAAWSGAMQHKTTPGSGAVLVVSDL